MTMTERLGAALPFPYQVPAGYGRPVAVATVPLVFTDCETDGLRDRRRPWEIAGIRRDPDGTMTALHVMIADPHLADAEPEALRIGRFHERHPLAAELCERYGLAWPDELDQAALDVAATGPRPALVSELDTALALVELTDRAHIVGAVPNFDVETYRAMLARHRDVASHVAQHLAKGWKLDIPLSAGRLGRYESLARTPELLTWRGHYHLLDAENLVAGQLGLLPPYDSDALSRAVGVQPMPDQQRHTAFGDTLWAMSMFDAVMAHAGR